MSDAIGRVLRQSGRAAWRALVTLLTGDDLTHAAAIAYYALLSLFPFLLLVMVLLGVVTADEADRRLVLDFVLRYLPARLDFVKEQLDAFRDMRLGVGLAGAVSLVWASVGVFSAITGAVDQAWGGAHRRNVLGHRLASFAMLASAGGVMVLALVVVSAVQVAQSSWLGSVLGNLALVRGVEALVLRTLSTLLAMAGAVLVFYFVPNAPVRLRDVWCGAIAAGALWRLALELFSQVLRLNSGLAYVPGSVAAVVAFLLWVYLSAVILLFGVECTVAHARLREAAVDAGASA